MTPVAWAATLGPGPPARSRIRTHQEGPRLSEIAALALGLLIGIGAGAVLLSVLRPRPRRPREIRLTVTANALPHQRALTLAVDHARAGPGVPGRGGPADPANLAVGHSAPSRFMETRTPVPVMVAAADNAVSPAGA
ncbi:MAG: hypothetical protein ACRDGQ_10030, partial [Candidatus Limnocylindrales bacterium]